MKLLDVEPISWTTGPAFVCGPSGGGLKIVTLPNYPDAEGRALKRARLAAGLSQRELAKRIGITRAELSRVEVGMQRPEDWAEFWRAAGLREEGSE